jgi:hypothetical protein
MFHAAEVYSYRLSIDAVNKVVSIGISDRLIVPRSAGEERLLCVRAFARFLQHTLRGRMASVTRKHASNNPFECKFVCRFHSAQL